MGHAKPLREIEAEAAEEGSLGPVRAHEAAQAELTAILSAGKTTSVL